MKRIWQWLEVLLLCVMSAYCFVPAQAAGLLTVQNSTLSVPASSFANEASGFTNLVGSNVMVAGVGPASLHGGRAWLGNAQQWVRRFPAGALNLESTPRGIVVLPNGNIVVTGYTYTVNEDFDFLTICYTPDGAPIWTNRYDDPNHGDDMAFQVARGTKEDLWVAGQSMRYETNSLLTDVVLVRYASDGTPLSTNLYTSASTNEDWPFNLSVDVAGNAYVAVSSAYWPPPPNSGIPVGETILKYDAAGHAVWTNIYPATAPDSGQNLHDAQVIAPDPDGNLLIAGVAGGQYWNTGTSLVKFSNDGVPVWTNYHPFAFILTLRSVLADAHSDIILTGETFTNSTPVYVIMKCSRDGASLWTNAIMGPTYDGGDVPQTLLDPAGNVILVGGSVGSSPGLYQVLKLSPDGLPLWTNLTADFGTNNSMLYATAVDSMGNLYLAGDAPNPDNGYADFVVMKYSRDGQALWTNRFDGDAGLDDYPFAMVLDATGNPYITGESKNPSRSWEFATVKYADKLFYAPPRDFTGIDIISYTLTDNLGNNATGAVQVVVTPGAFHFSLSPNATGPIPGGFQLQIDGVPGTNSVVIEASTDCQNWQPILTNAPIGGSVRLLDPSVLSRRYYRAVQQQ